MSRKKCVTVRVEQVQGISEQSSEENGLFVTEKYKAI